jgi:hypothetical protein
MEKPVIVYSSWLGANHKGVYNQKDFAIYSNKLAQKAGYKTILYTDKKSKEFLKEIPFNEIIDFDENILSQLPKTMWAAGKLLAISKQKDAFIHIDFDMFIFKNIFLEKIQNSDFFIFHEESWTRKFGLGSPLFRNGTKKILDITNNIFDVNLDETSMSLNFSMFGTCQKEKALVIAEEANNLILKLIKINKILEDDRLQNYFKKVFGNMSFAIISIVIEQIIFPNILTQRRKYSYSPILNVDTPEETNEVATSLGLLHLWGAKDNKNIQNIVNQKFSKLIN